MDLLKLALFLPIRQTCPDLCVKSNLVSSGLDLEVGNVLCLTLDYIDYWCVGSLYVITLLKLKCQPSYVNVGVLSVLYR